MLLVVNFTVDARVQIDILGCSGGIGEGLKTTCMLINNRWLLDAGTGVEQLSREQMQALDGVFLTHAHMDHICCLPMLMPIVNQGRKTPFRIFARAEVIEALLQHVLNDIVWPDFTQIPTPETSLIQLCPLELGVEKIFDDLKVTPVEVHHTTPAVGYVLDSGNSAIAFTGDCDDSPAFWKRLSQQDNLTQVLVDISFPSSYQEVATLSAHYTAASLAKDLQQWPVDVPKPIIGVSHLKPSYESQILAECESLLGEGWTINVINRSDCITF